MPDILLVIRQPGNVRVLSQTLERHGYTCTGANDSETLDKAIRRSATPDLALVDVAGLGEAVWPMCEKLQQSNVPFIVLSAKQQMGLSSKTIGYGAVSVLEKPIVKASLLQLIGNLIQARVEAGANAYEQVPR